MAAAATPSLRLVTRSPLVVKGAHFHSGERVTLKLGDAKLVVRAGVTGAFQANLGSLIPDRCSFAIVAAGARGDQAVVLLRTACPPASPASPAAPASPVAPLPVPA
jgi:hypothetical protein